MDPFLCTSRFERHHFGRFRCSPVMNVPRELYIYLNASGLRKVASGRHLFISKHLGATFRHDCMLKARYGALAEGKNMFRQGFAAAVLVTWPELFCHIGMVSYKESVGTQTLPLIFLPLLHSRAVYKATCLRSQLLPPSQAPRLAAPADMFCFSLTSSRTC